MSRVSCNYSAQEDMMEDSAEAEGVVPTDSDGAEASQVGHHM